LQHLPGAGGERDHHTGILTALAAMNADRVRIYIRFSRFVNLAHKVSLVANYFSPVCNQNSGSLLDLCRFTFELRTANTYDG